MNYFHSTLYGLIQGCTEFLPVSSSGHLALLPHFFHIKDPGVVFDLSMHLGTALAVFIYFYKDVVSLISYSFHWIKNPLNFSQYPYVVNYFIATLSTVFLALILKKYVESWGRNPTLIGFNLIFFGLLMGIIDYFCAQKKNLSLVNKFSLKDSILIGLTQVLSLFPGVSRSGITLTSSRFLNYSRANATKFSFLLSLPLILGGGILKVPEIVSDTTSFSYEVLLWGILVSFVTGFLTIHFFLKMISKVGLMGFAIYRVILGIFILILF